MTVPNAGTKLSPIGVFSVIGCLPKADQDRFRKFCYVEVVNDETEFVPDPELKYDHVLGLSWLTQENIPNTVEALAEQRERVFKTMVSGPVRYNVGQFFVLFPNVVYGTNDVSDVLMIVEVLDDLDFPAEMELVTKDDPEWKKLGYMESAAHAIRAALHDYVATGRIKIHEGGMRMYTNDERYKFQSRYEYPETKPVSFKDAVRRHRRE